MSNYPVNPTRFAGKVTLVTAGASGIGRGIACRLAAEGARVVVGDIDDALLSKLVAGSDGTISGVHCDVREESEVESLVNVTVERHGRLDCAVNVAGVGGGALLVDTTAEAWDAVQSLSLRGCFFSIKHEARQFLVQGGGGSIVNIASINALTAAESVGPYNAAKAGVVNLTMTAAIELGEHGVRVNAVGPGLVDTPMTKVMTEVPALVEAFREATPLERYGQPEDIAAAVAFLASDDAQWITGQTLYVDGGQTVTGYPRLNRIFASAAGLPSSA